jgi:hypothetical protein
MGWATLQGILSQTHLVTLAIVESFEQSTFALKPTHGQGDLTFLF